MNHTSRIHIVYWPFVAHEVTAEELCKRGGQAHRGGDGVTPQASLQTGRPKMRLLCVLRWTAPLQPLCVVEARSCVRAALIIFAIQQTLPCMRFGHLRHIM